MTQQKSQQSQSFNTSNKIQELRERFFSYIINYFEKGYKYIKVKQPKSQQQVKYLRSYENMFLLQSLGLIFMVTSGFYFLKLYRGTAHLANKQLRKLLVKTTTVAFLGAGTSASAMFLNSKQKVLEKTQIYGKQFQNLAKSITPLNLA